MCIKVMVGSVHPVCGMVGGGFCRLWLNLVCYRHQVLTMSLSALYLDSHWHQVCHGDIVLFVHSLFCNDRYDKHCTQTVTESMVMKVCLCIVCLQ